MEQKLFTHKQINVSAFLGGPIPPGILFFKNYMRLGKKREAYMALIFTILFTAVLFNYIMNLPDEVLDKIPNIVFTSIYTLITYLYYKKYMYDDVQQAYESGASKASNWPVAGATILGMLVSVGIAMLFAISQPYFPGEMKMINGNELYFDESLQDSEPLNTFANQLVKIDFFGEDYDNIARLQEKDDSYIITLNVSDEYWTYEDYMHELATAKHILNFKFGKPVVMKLESVSLTGQTRYKTLD